MKKTLLCVVFLLVTVSAHARGAVSYGSTGNVNLMIGQKSMNSSDWGSLDNQGELGVLFDYREGNWPVSLAVDFFGSSDSKDWGYGGTHKASTTELCVGVKKIWDFRGSPVKPFIGGGLAYITGEDKLSGYDYNNYYYSDSLNDSAFGFWISGGVYFTLSQHFNLGVIARMSRAKINLGGDNVEAGGEHIGLLLGYHW